MDYSNDELISMEYSLEELLRMGYSGVQVSRNEYSIEDFSCYFFITCTMPHDLTEKFIDKVNSKVMERIILLVDYFHRNHHDDFTDIVKNLPGKLMTSKEQFMKCLVSRCLQMTEEPTEFHFILACAFINSIVHMLFKLNECFKIVEIASKCLTAIFYRQYVSVFEKIDGLNGLSVFCKRIKISLDENPAFQNTIKNRVISLTQKMKEIDHSNFLLNNNEKKLLYGRPDYKPLSQGDVFLMIQGEDFPADDDISLDFAMEDPDAYSEVALDRIHKLCSLCKTKCGMYVVNLNKQLRL